MFKGLPAILHLQTSIISLSSSLPCIRLINFLLLQ